MSSSSASRKTPPALERFSRFADTVGWAVLPWALIVAALMVVARAMFDPVSNLMPLIPYLFIAVAIIAVPIVLLMALPPMLVDALRFGGSRVWAISSVVYAEAIRKRVLWVTPLAIVGVIAVSQFQRGVDEEDSIRQIIKACIFATGLVVVITTIILTCTNLPKEIENRVIFTIVTKPTTRLEIMLGKIAGFARVSGMILLIMGIFSLTFLKIKEWQLLRSVNARLNGEQVDEANRAVLQHYRAAGLLGTRSMAPPDGLEVLSNIPNKGEPRRISGGESQNLLVPFNLTEAEKDTIVKAVNAGGALLVVTDIPYEQHEPTAEEAKDVLDLRLPTPESRKLKVQGPTLPSTQPAKEGWPIPQFSLNFFDKNGARIVTPDKLNGGQAIDLQPPTSHAAATCPIPPDAVETLRAAGQFSLQISATTPSVQYIAKETPAVLLVLNPAGQPVLKISPTGPVEIRSNFGRYGMQLKGRAEGTGSVAVFHFNGARDPQTSQGKATFEVRIGIEGSSRDFNSPEDAIARMSVQVRNSDTGTITDPSIIVPEHLRANFVSVPAEFVKGGKFDVIVRGLTHEQWFGIQPNSVSLVVADRSFAVNLMKSLLILWMLSILVVVIAFFCSTFLSWPVAIVLTLLLLLGRWGVLQVGDAGGSGLGSEVTQSLGLQNPTSAKIVRESVNALSSALNFLAIFLPDISRFSATEDIDKGISIPGARIGEAAIVLFGYGLPLTVLTYAVFRRKEVAP